MNNAIFPALFALSLSFIFYQCQEPVAPKEQLASLAAHSESIEGSSAYLNSPYVTAGDRVYVVGHQNGQFPDLGWHVEGEMGGIWDHPIKLMDGFTNSIIVDGESFCLIEADTFINYPFASKMIYRSVTENLDVERFQFVPDGKEAVMLEYIFHNHAETEQELTFRFNGFSDLRPVWLGERTNMRDGKDIASWDEALGAWIIKDSLNEWYTVFGSSVLPETNDQVANECVYNPAGNGTHAAMEVTITVPAGGKAAVPISIAGSSQSRNQAIRSYQEVLNQAVPMLEAKQQRYEQIARQTDLEIPDKKLETAFRWTKYNVDWLVRDVPQIGRGLSAGLPDYPWWFGVDSEYALQGVLMAGQWDVVYRTIDLLYQLSEKTNDNGRVIHEASTNGVVFNPGNINETPQFASLIWKVYQWTGDKAFLQRYYPFVKEGLQWLLAEADEDQNGLPDGFGMMEIHGMDSEMIDVAVYTQKALAEAAEMAKIMGDSVLCQDYENKAGHLRQMINTDFWVPEYHSYADFIGTTQQAQALIKDAIHRADSLQKPWAVKELQATSRKIAGHDPNQKAGFVLHHNWVVNTPMQTCVADSAKAIEALETGNHFVNPFGVFVTGIDRDETAGEDMSSFASTKKNFTYVGAVMTLPTGVQAIGENNYGRPDQALDYLQRMTRSFSFAAPGSMYEVSPDYGMLVQAWNIYSLAIPLVEQFFGILPRADLQTVRIQPQMPTTWDTARVSSVRIGENQIGVNYKKAEKTTTITIYQSLEDWTIEFALPKEKFIRWKLNGKVVEPDTEEAMQVLQAKGKKIDLELLSP